MLIDTTNLGLPRLLERRDSHPEFLKKEEDPADNPNYFRVVQTSLQFISEDFKEGSAIGLPSNNPHDLPVRYYPGERLREVFSFRKHGIEFFDLSNETDFLCALD